MSRWGFFITFEGIEGCGKSTLARKLYEYLKEDNFNVVFTREPGGPEVAEDIRSILLKPDRHVEPWTEVFLLLAARHENVKKVIYPTLANSGIVISDRFSDSTFAYQCYGRGLPYKVVSRFNKFATSGIKPNLTFLIDLPVEKGLARLDDGHLDRMEQEALDFHHRVREGYLKLARRAGKRFYVLNGLKSPEELFEETKSITLKRLEEKGPIGRFRRKA